jgi:hypothetical protein
MPFAAPCWAWASVFCELCNRRRAVPLKVIVDQHLTLHDLVEISVSTMIGFEHRVVW